MIWMLMLISLFSFVRVGDRPPASTSSRAGASAVSALTAGTPRGLLAAGRRSLAGRPQVTSSRGTLLSTRSRAASLPVPSPSLRAGGRGVTGGGCWERLLHTWQLWLPFRMVVHGRVMGGVDS